MEKTKIKEVWHPTPTCMLSKAFRSVRECVKDANDYITSYGLYYSHRGLNPMTEGQTKALPIYKRPHLFGEVPRKLFKFGWYRYSNVGDGERYKADSSLKHRQRSLRYQCSEEENPIWTSVLKRMCRREMEGKSEIFWDYFLHELGWKYRHMDLKPEGGKTAPQELCKRCTFPGSLCRTLVSGSILCF